MFAAGLSSGCSESNQVYNKTNTNRDGKTYKVWFRNSCKQLANVKKQNIPKYKFPKMQDELT